ncbi:prophage endopeptidase tail family protein [Listeria booriae]|uniref:prophage endopeptidase tail family protein n=1 Tax=Listeria booriae TaxID=1552123 RepID=UPI0016271409|nr:prophage endopeptidase tail family protein [Listeria booriae]MBC1272692.1 hypothetical protein [Listeria booriae]
MKAYPLIKTNEYEEKLIDIFDFQESWAKNELWQISFKILQTDLNAFEFELIENEKIIEYDGQDYSIKVETIHDNEAVIGKEVSATHIMYNVRNHVINDVNEGAKTYSISAALQFLLGSNEHGFSWVIHGTYPSVTSENLGDLDGVESVNFVCERFGAVCIPDNRVLHFYPEASWGTVTQYQFRAGYNTQNTKLSISTTKLKTAIMGFGKQVATTDTFYQYSTAAIERAGSGWVSEGGYWTATKFNDAFKFSFAGTGLRVKMMTSKLGGKWTFKIDNKHTKQISVYNASGTEEKVFEIKRGLDSATHTVVCTFVSRDGTNPNTKAPKMAKNILNSGAFIGTYRKNEKGDQVYTFDPISYVSPNVSNWNGGKKMWAKAIRDDTITNPATMLARLKSELQDVPEVSLTTEFLDSDEFGKGDTWLFYHDRMRFDTDVKIIGYTKYPYDASKSSEVVFSNSRKAMSDIQRDIKKATIEAQRKLKNIGKTVIENIPADIKESTASVTDARNANVEFSGDGIQTSKQEGYNILQFGNGVLSLDGDDVLIDERGINLAKTFGALPPESQGIGLIEAGEVK